ncbi:MAG: transaldolase family protein [Candidatus Limnocylindrales bacterium]
MRILIDSADLGAIRDALSTGLVAGVTTNPTLLRRAGVSRSGVPGLARAAFSAGAGEVHLQALADDTPGMIRDGLEFVEIDSARVHVKLVATRAGYRAAAALAAKGLNVTMTAVYTLNQALAAQSVGARSIAIYLGRLRDAGVDAMDLAGRMQTLLGAQGADVDILAASIRDPGELAELAIRGVASATIAPAILERLLDSDATTRDGLVFTTDARSMPDA